jgi:hypothetical protein
VCENRVIALRARWVRAIEVAPALAAALKFAAQSSSQDGN